MILSLAANPALGSGNQRRYKDGMPFGTRGGMSAEHNFPADGEYVLTIGDMALARTVPNMEFESTVVALLDGKEFWRTTLGGEEDHTAIVLGEERVLLGIVETVAIVGDNLAGVDPRAERRVRLGVPHLAQE